MAGFFFLADVFYRMKSAPYVFLHDIIDPAFDTGYHLDSPPLYYGQGVAADFTDDEAGD